MQAATLKSSCPTLKPYPEKPLMSKEMYFEDFYVGQTIELDWQHQGDSRGD